MRRAQGATARSRWSAPEPACSSTPISRRPRSPGCSTMSPGARERAERGELAFGTIDCFLLWRLTGGAVHATDVTNASRTSLFDIHAQRWDARAVPAVPRARGAAARGARQQPHVRRRPRPACSTCRSRSPEWRATSRRRLFGQACFAPGMAKSTYGTGCFMLLNTGARRSLAAPAADHARLPAGRRDHLRARRLDLRRRGGGQMAARRARRDRRRGRNRQHGDPGARQPRRLHGPGLRRARRAVLGSGGARARSSG